MFLFFHSEQNEKNTSYYKGLLFEELLKQYLEGSGYDIELRKKESSLEYDIEGFARATGQKIIGEAKAHSKSMSGPTVAAFVGKLLPLGLPEKKVHGLFLSLSPLTPEAENYFRSVEKMGLTAKVGKELYNQLTVTLHLPTEDFLYREIKGYDLVAPNILKTDTGLYKLFILKEVSSGTPSNFVVFNKSGNLIEDERFLEALKIGVSELAGLDFIMPNKQKIVDETPQVKREIVRGLTVGTEWADYRLPAGPTVFVGRNEFIGELLSHIKHNELPNVLQIKSRSGVGKSSLVSFLENKLSIDGVITELHDSRDVKTIYDVFYLVQRFTKSSIIATNFIELDEQLKNLQLSLNSQKAVFFVDQFESTFSNPDIFDCYEYIANSITKLRGGVYIVFARKNDQLTTYDNSKVSLNRINQLSKSFTLPDFENKESILLLEKINENSSNILSKEILPYIIEFAQGFPWLLKRTIAHVLKLTRKGDSQRDLISAGLKLNDLFEEELEGLDEIEKDYLVKIAAKLPADFNELQYQFDEDPMLVKVLDKLTAYRLVRLSGSTYDTYNDVFKEYLVYQKLPEFRLLVIYRMYPSSVLSQFHKLITMRKLTIAKITENLNVREGYAFNLVKELRNLDLLDAVKSGEWIIPTNVRDIYSQGTLAGYLRRKILDNQLVETLFKKILSGEKVFENDIPKYFSESYPFIEASEKTWGLYSTILKSWLLALKIIEIDEEGRITASDVSHNDATAELGNLKKISGLRAGNKGLFFPVTSHAKMIEVTSLILNGEEPAGKEASKAKSDLNNAGVLVGGHLAVSNIEELNEALTAQILDDGYEDFWKAIHSDQPCYEIFKSIAGEGLTESTLIWRLRKLTALAKKLKIIPNKRFKY
ncbi:nSTAND1 domain-containing NTPase [Pantoea stewartii]|uniref:nSTAND1 domain-containing NTPase n=1 Tax=Pantoea stewartii TaxID=66269 RepID=UPI0006D0214C|nr:restriction endonuclease [Pantoea stewartii]